MIKRLGFFRELSDGDKEGPSLRESSGKGDGAIRHKIADYLASGAYVVVTGQEDYDVLQPERVAADNRGIQTDGQSVWLSSLPYYVREYNLRLPAEFVEWVRSNNWKTPELSDEEVDQIVDEILPGHPID